MMNFIANIILNFLNKKKEKNTIKLLEEQARKDGFKKMTINRNRRTFTSMDNRGKRGSNKFDSNWHSIYE